MKTYIIQLAAYFLSVVCISASGEASVAPRYTKVEIVAGKSGYIFNLKADEDAQLTELSIKWNAVESRCTEKDFGKLKNVYMRGLDVTTSRSLEARGPLDGVIVTIPYYHKTITVKGEEWEIIDIIRMHFEKGKLVMWQKAESDPNKPMNWKFSTWDAKQGIQDNGEGMYRNNPYALFIFGKESP